MSDIEKATAEALAIAKGESPAARIYHNGHFYVPQAEIERLRAALRDDPTPEQVADACLSFRHDYGLMPKVDRARLAWEATEWLRAWQKTFACTALGEKP